MIDAPLALALASGMVATVNPCGFAMLPAYLSYFLGVEGGARDEEDDARASVASALLVGATVSLGFIVVFAIVGTIVNAGAGSFRDYVKWVTIFIGIVLMVMGVALLRGHHLPFTTPRLDRGGRTRSLGSIFVFGVSYAIASISCTLPIFLAQVFSTFSREDFASGLASFVAYGLGMSLVLMTLTVAVALAKRSLVQAMRSAVRWSDRVGGVLLLLAGGYLVYYWVFTITSDPGDTSPLIRFTDDLSADIATRIQDWGATRVALVLGMAVAGALAFVLLARRATRPGTRTPVAKR